MNNKRNALGRGLSALLESASTDITSNIKSNNELGAVVGAVTNLPLLQIEVNPFQPRSHFEQQALNELVESIKLHGIIQPVTVRKMGYDRFQLISGERRFRASQLAGLETIPAYVRVANDQAMLEMALVENIQRENLDAIEIAISYKRLIEECSLTQEQLSEKVSKQRSTVTNYLRLLKLPPEVQLGIREKKISMGHARALINVEKAEDMVEIYHRIMEDDLSVRDVEELTRDKKKIEPRLKHKNLTGNLTEKYSDKLKSLSKQYNAKIELKSNVQGAGKIIIPFANEDDLDKIIDALDI
ncbi:MAG: ParB/RepB/Spo0J family partition protein [Bacteroidetes bacterium]|nr:ParB/RepB/Spo0J family partition protein [Bacteroidota bacterium]PHX83284.1 MAG: chromosome partitioning protein ParB [Flavobacteriales bacterium]